MFSTFVDSFTADGTLCHTPVAVFHFQGDINYEIPRINTDLPIVLYEAGENAVMCR